MKGRWAGISGYVENREQPLNRALKEIAEETGLAGGDVQLVNIGVQLEAVEKASPETVWVVHPFLFRSNSNIIKLDRENEDYHWIDPEKIENYDTVPKLKEALVSAMQGVS